MFQTGGVLFSVLMKSGELAYHKHSRRKVEESIKVLEYKINDVNNDIKDLQKCIGKLDVSTNHEVQLLRAELEKQGKKEILGAMESMLKEQLVPLSQKFHTLEEVVQKLQETTNHVVQLLRAGLEEQGKKEILGAVESMLKEQLVPLSQKFHTLEEDVQKWQETTNHEVQLLRAELEKQGKKEILGAVESMLKEQLVPLSQKFHTLEEDVQKWQETTNHEVQLLRAELEKQGNNVEESSRELVSMLDNKFGQLSQNFHTLEEDVQKWQETTKHEIQIMRADLEKQGKKEDERSMALLCRMDRMDMLLQQVSQGFQTLEQTLQWRLEFPAVLQLFQVYLENNQGIAMLREEIIHRPVLELAGGERISNICTDSRSAFGIGPAQGAVWNRRLREARGFFRSVSGGEVQRITPGSSDNLHANQDQRTACLGSLCRSIEGIQRSMDIRASRTNNLQVLMLTLGVLISIVILARIFTLSWPWSPHSHQLLL